MWEKYLKRLEIDDIVGEDNGVNLGRLFGSSDRYKEDRLFIT
jgi:hypothetical protein